MAGATHLAAPTYPWTDMTLAAFTAENAPFSAAWLAALWRNQIHLKEVIYGSGAYVATIPHDHDGAEDAHPHADVTYNAVSVGAPTKRAYREHGGRYVTRGFADPGAANVLQGGLQGDYLQQLLYRETVADETNVLGGGTDMVFSLFARTLATTASVGWLVFGEEVGDSVRVKSAFSSEATHRTSVESAAGVVGADQLGGLVRGNRGMVHAGDINSNWKRFWFRAVRVGRAARQDSRYAIRVGQTFDSTIEITGLMASPGRRLHPYSVSPADNPGATGTSNGGYNNMPTTGVPLYDWTVSMDSAVELEGF